MVYTLLNQKLKHLDETSHNEEYHLLSKVHGLL